MGSRDLSVDLLGFRVGVLLLSEMTNIVPRVLMALYNLGCSLCEVSLLCILTQSWCCHSGSLLFQCLILWQHIWLSTISCFSLTIPRTSAVQFWIITLLWLGVDPNETLFYFYIYHSVCLFSCDSASLCSSGSPWIHCPGRPQIHNPWASTSKCLDLRSMLPHWLYHSVFGINEFQVCPLMITFRVCVVICMLDKYSTIELHSRPRTTLFFSKVTMCT